jgi:MarR family transcriptional regulator, lower aerobic nicotinate degradation pathway regulator
VGLQDVVDQTHAPGYLLRRAQQAHTEAWTRTVARVTGPQYSVLVAVAGWPGLDQTRAGELASLDKATAAGIVGRLVVGGWLEHVADPADGRRRLLDLTLQGRRDLPQLTADARKVQVHLLASLPEREREPFVDILGRVARLEGSCILQQRAEERVLVMARTPGYLIRRAQQLHTAYWGDKVRDITGPQYAVLAATLRAGVATYAEIGAGASLDSSSTRDIVERLTEKGWLEPVDNMHDRRSRPVRATAPAAAAMRLLRDRVLDVQRQLLDPLPAADRDQLIAWLRLVAGIDQASQPSPR